jgi:hypothetical protein
MADVDETRDELLRLTWAQVRGWTPENLMNLPAARRLLEAGASSVDLATAMNAASYEAVFGLLALLDERADPDGESDDDSWALVDPESNQSIDGLHEDLLTADPTGQEGQDLFA